MADDSTLRFIVDAIAASGEIKMDFKQLATSTGIARSDNAGTKFQNQLKKCGLKYDKDQSRLIKLDGNSAPTTPTTKSPATKKAAANGQKTGRKHDTPKKRKLEDLLGSASEGGDSSDGKRKTKEEDEA